LGSTDNGHHFTKTGEGDGATTFKTSPAPGAATKDEEAQQLKQQWTTTNDKSLEELKEAILATPTLK
jgi:hypothetical protein